MKISSELKKNADAIKNCIKSQDIIYYNGKSGSVDYCVIYVDSVTDKNQVGLLLLSPLNNNPSATVADCENVLNIPNIALIDDMNKAVKELLGGKTLVFFSRRKKRACLRFFIVPDKSCSRTAHVGCGKRSARRVYRMFKNQHRSAPQAH